VQGGAAIGATEPVARSLHRRRLVVAGVRAIRTMLWVCVLPVVGAACVPDPGMNPLSPEETTNKALGRLCTAIYNIQGTFEVGMAKPSEIVGCWPVGVWRFQAMLGDSNCESTPDLETQYAFQVARDSDMNESYTYLNHPGADHVHMKVSSGGGGVCEAGFEIFSADGMGVLTLKPAIQSDSSINGFGQYDLYDSDQWKGM
jgi:hypothetical protein